MADKQKHQKASPFISVIKKYPMSEGRSIPEENRWEKILSSIF